MVASGRLPRSLYINCGSTIRVPLLRANYIMIPDLRLKFAQVSQSCAGHATQPSSVLPSKTAPAISQHIGSSSLCLLPQALFLVEKFMEGCKSKKTTSNCSASGCRVAGQIGPFWIFCWTSSMSHSCCKCARPSLPLLYDWSSTAGHPRRLER